MAPNAPPHQRSVDRRSLLRYSGLSLATVTGLGGCVENGTRDPVETDALNASTPSRASGTEATQNPSTETEETDVNNTRTDTEDPGEGEPEPTESPTETESPQQEWYIQPAGRPESVPSALECDEPDVTRFEQRFRDGAIRWGGGDDSPWTLRVDTPSIGYGQTVRIRLRNVSASEQSRGTEHKHNIQLKTNAGWQELRVREAPQHEARSDEAIIHDPGETHTWEFAVSEDAIPMTDRDGVQVCPDLHAGRYRFVFYAIDTPFGVSFDVKT